MFIIEYDESRKVYTKEGKVLMPITERSSRRLDMILYAGITLFFISLIVIITVLYQDNMKALKQSKAKATVTQKMKS
jgi:type VI protein secretion system component VasK